MFKGRVEKRFKKTKGGTLFYCCDPGKSVSILLMVSM
jgi:hypothetical protein